MLEEAPGQVGIEVEHDGVNPDGTSGVDGSFSPDEPEPAHFGNPLLATIAFWLRGRVAYAFGDEEVGRAGLTCRLAVELLGADRAEPAARRA